VLYLAMRLKKTVAEIESMTLDEYREWVAFFKVMAEEHARAEQRSSQYRRNG
jgi:hypothetical protein